MYQTEQLSLSLRKGKATEMEIKSVVAMGWNRGRSLFMNGHKGAFWSNVKLFFDINPFIKTQKYNKKMLTLMYENYTEMKLIVTQTSLLMGNQIKLL